MKKSARQAKKAANARLSGAIPSSSTKNKKIIFSDDEGDRDSVQGELIQVGNDNVGDNDSASNADGEDDGMKGVNAASETGADDDEAVEEVKGSVARDSTQRLRELEREMAKGSSSKKRRKKKVDELLISQSGDCGENQASESDDEGEDDMLTDDFFKSVDSERANRSRRERSERKDERLRQRKMRGKHTTFVVEDERKAACEPRKVGQNIEVVAIGGDGDAEFYDRVEDERRVVVSAKLGSVPSGAAITFARGGMMRGASRERGSGGKKRKTGDEETWKRSRKFNRLGIGSRPGQAAAVFARKR